MNQDTKINKSNALRALYMHESREVRFITNVLESCSNSAKRIKGLYNLVIINGVKVTTIQFEMFGFTSVDTGKQYSFESLENWILVYQEIQNDIIAEELKSL
jgi:hypothetical protein